MSNSQQTALRPKRTKTAKKRLSAQKRLKRKQNQSLQKIVTEMRSSFNNSHLSNTSDLSHAISAYLLSDEKKSSIHDLTDGESILFIEDRTGDDSMHATVMKDVVNCMEKNENFKHKRSNTTHSDKSDRFSPARKKSKTSPNMASSTPITKRFEQNSLNSSCISAVSKVSPYNCKFGLSREINNLTRDIRQKDYATIDLTNGTDSTLKTIDLTSKNIQSSHNSSVIDLDKEEGECSIISVSISEPEVTVVNAIEHRKRKLNERQIAEGIAQMNSSEKGRLLAMITDKIFNGCQVTDSKQHIQPNKTRSAEDSYIRDMIKGNIRHSIGDNVYNPGNDCNRSGLRMIVIDGSNVAMQHGMKRIFSVKGLKICIDFFLKKGHTVKAFVPQYRCHANKSSDPQLLDYLERRGLVVYTPSRKLDDGRCISSYDDRFIVQCAAEFDGVIVSQDRYRDLVAENPKWRLTIEKRLLQFTWVQDMIMFPQDPLGKDGPCLAEFLKHTS